MVYVLILTKMRTIRQKVVGLRTRGRCLGSSCPSFLKGVDVTVWVFVHESPDYRKSRVSYVGVQRKNTRLSFSVEVGFR